MDSGVRAGGRPGCWGPSEEEHTEKEVLTVYLPAQSRFIRVLLY